MTQTEQQNVPALRFPGFEETWEDLKLGDFLEIKSASRVHKDEWRETGVPFFRSSDVVSAFKGNENKKAFISNTLFEKLAKKSSKVAKGDLLVTGGGSIGIPYLIQSDAPLYFKDADLLWIRNSGEVEGFYLYTFFSGPIFRRYVQSITHIGTISHYTIEQARATPINLPTLPEQRKIAGFLAAVDERIAQVTRKKALLEDYKKGCMQQLFSQSIRFKDDQGNDFPDWEEKRLGEVLTIGSGKDYKHLEAGEIPVYGTGGLMTHVDEFLYDGESVCIGRKGTIDKPALVEGKFWTVDTLFYTHSFKNALPRFIYAVFQQINWQVHNEASGVPSLSKSTIERLKITLPHPDEQQKIADFLSAIDTKIDLVAQELEQAKTFKKGLLQQMFV